MEVQGSDLVEELDEDYLWSQKAILKSDEDYREDLRQIRLTHVLDDMRKVNLKVDLEVHSSIKTDGEDLSTTKDIKVFEVINDLFARDSEKGCKQQTHLILPPSHYNEVSLETGWCGEVSVEDAGRRVFDGSLQEELVVTKPKRISLTKTKKGRGKENSLRIVESGVGKDKVGVAVAGDNYRKEHFLQAGHKPRKEKKAKLNLTLGRYIRLMEAEKYSHQGLVGRFGYRSMATKEIHM